VRVQGSGVAADLPTGWEAGISGAEASRGANPRLRVAHFANFPLPAQRADFGGDVVEAMRPGDAFIVLFEYEPESAGEALFAARGVPLVDSRDFDRDTVQYPIPGQSGVQRFFQERGRAFCLYVVVGSHVDRADILPQVKSVIASIEVA
jgi:hypothetical protein